MCPASTVLPSVKQRKRRRSTVPSRERCEETWNCPSSQGWSVDAAKFARLRQLADPTQAHRRPGQEIKAGRWSELLSAHQDQTLTPADYRSGRPPESLSPQLVDVGGRVLALAGVRGAHGCELPDASTRETGLSAICRHWPQADVDPWLASSSRSKVVGMRSRAPRSPTMSW